MYLLCVFLFFVLGALRLYTLQHGVKNRSHCVFDRSLVGKVSYCGYPPVPVCHFLFFCKHSCRSINNAVDHSARRSETGRHHSALVNVDSTGGVAVYASPVALKATPPTSRPRHVRWTQNRDSFVLAFPRGYSGSKNTTPTVPYVSGSALNR